MGVATKRISSAAGPATEYVGEDVAGRKGKTNTKRKILLTTKDQAATSCHISNQQNIVEPSHLVEHSIHKNIPAFYCSSFMLENTAPSTFLGQEFPLTHGFPESFSFMNHPSPLDNFSQQPLVTGLRSAAAGLTSLCQNDSEHYDGYLMNGMPMSMLPHDWNTSRGCIPTMRIAPKQLQPIKQKPLTSVSSMLGTSSQLSLGAKSDSMSFLSKRPGNDSSMSIPCFTPQYIPKFSNSNSSRNSHGKDPRRAEHIACEHKRRFRIKHELNRLNEMVPGLMGCPRNSQAKIMQAAADYMEKVIQENARLRMELAALRTQRSSSEPKD